MMHDELIIIDHSCLWDFSRFGFLPFLIIEKIDQF